MSCGWVDVVSGSPCRCVRQLLCAGCGLGGAHLRLSQSRQGIAFIPMVRYNGLGTFCLRCSSGPLAASWVLCVPSACLLGGSGCLLDASWMSSGCLWVPPGFLLGASWVLPGVSWVAPECLLSVSWVSPGCLWLPLGVSWLPLGGCWVFPMCVLSAFSVVSMCCQIAPHILSHDSFPMILHP